ncbi:DnaA regulatory inactivator Hda [Lysobacter sp. N42]|uniref:DnaA regulatory inactivator Hda n=1 Tax=Lysobacter sp. N42 TaxID=2545719 RepID=UPI00104E2D0A|nr:DnaA regulatory inactivator Hda [Lysobacter sp. N42]TCZ83896.1 DnaA regulatory inactivator Hda [Lysobacter sp. N42]
MPQGSAPAQLPLALRYPPDQRLATFVGAPAGTLAHLEALARGEAVDWLYVSGPAGIGKSHLLLAACAQAQEAGRRPAYLALARAAGRLADALQALEGMDLVALDGLEAVAGVREDEVALFDFHNRARAAGIAVVYAAIARPDALELVLPDLRSRLGQCSGVVLSALDDAGRREVLRQRAQRRGLSVDEAALDWLLRRVGRDLGSLTQLFDQLDRAALAAQRRLTVPFLRQVLGQVPEA